jgi:hypothetical protein
VTLTAVASATGDAEVDVVTVASKAATDTPGCSTVDRRRDRSVLRGDGDRRLTSVGCG